MKPANILLIGVGPHARRIYVPALRLLASSLPVRLAAAVDLQRSRSTIDCYFREQGYEIEMLYLDVFDAADGIPGPSRTLLDALVDKFDVRGVVISTEPTAHKAYADWALG